MSALFVLTKTGSQTHKYCLEHAREGSFSRKHFLLRGEMPGETPEIICLVNPGNSTL